MDKGFAGFQLLVGVPANETEADGVFPELTAAENSRPVFIGFLVGNGHKKTARDAGGYDEFIAGEC